MSQPISGALPLFLNPCAFPAVMEEPQYLSPGTWKKLKAERELIHQLTNLSSEDKEFLSSPKILTMKEDEIPENLAFPFHYMDDRENARKLFVQLGSDPAYLNEIKPSGAGKQKTATMCVFCCREDFDLTSFYIENGGNFEVEKIWDEIGKNAFLDYPTIAQVIREIKWKEAKTIEAQITVLQDILKESCHKGNLPSVEWVFDKLRSNGIPGPIATSWTLEMAILGGFDDVIIRVLQVLDIAAIAPERKCELIDLALEMGYPETAQLLGRKGLPLSDTQSHKIEQMIEAHKINQEQITASAPAAINQTHAAIHGGSNNEAIYKKEYRAAVAYALNYIRNKGRFKSLIENLGHRRRRMAVLGNLKRLEAYGRPQARGTWMETEFGDTYAAYGEKARKKYGPDYFRAIATYTIPTTKKFLMLSEITPDRWQHPKGDQRDDVLDELDRLYQATNDNQGKYPEDKPEVLAEDLALIFWLISQNAPFSRGTPTIAAVLIDALWIYHGFKPFVPEKGIDLNCEALINIHHEEFVRYYADLVAAKNKPSAVEEKKV